MKVIYICENTLKDYVEAFNRKVEGLGEIVQISQLSPTDAFVYYEDGEEKRDPCSLRCADCSRYSWGIGCVATGELRLHRPTEEACEMFSTDPVYETEVEEYKEDKQEARWSQ